MRPGGKSSAATAMGGRRRRAAGLGLLAAVTAAASLAPPHADAAWRPRHRLVRIVRPPAAVDPASLCEAAIGRAETRYATPVALLTAISLVETGRPDHGHFRAWPWAIDVDGTPYMAPTRDAAIALTRTALLAGARSVDVGCMQVNLEQHPDAFLTLEDAFDPATNVNYATRFLLALHAGPARSVWATAVGFYHSQTPSLAGPYQARVLAIHQGLDPNGPPLPGAVAVAAKTAPSPFDLMKRAWAATIVDAPASP